MGLSVLLLWCLTTVWGLLSTFEILARHLTVEAARGKLKHLARVAAKQFPDSFVRRRQQFQDFNAHYNATTAELERVLEENTGLKLSDVTFLDGRVPSAPWLLGAAERRERERERESEPAAIYK